MDRSRHLVTHTLPCRKHRYTRELLSDVDRYTSYAKILHNPKTSWTSFPKYTTGTFPKKIGPKPKWKGGWNTRFLFLLLMAQHLRSQWQLQGWFASNISKKVYNQWKGAFGAIKNIMIYYEQQLKWSWTLSCNARYLAREYGLNGGSNLENAQVQLFKHWMRSQTIFLSTFDRFALILQAEEIVDVINDLQQAIVSQQTTYT